MTSGQQRAVAAVAGVILVVGLVLGAIALAGGDADEGDDAAAPTSSSAATSTSPTATTVPLQPVTTPPGATSTTAAPPDTTVSHPVVDGAGAVLTPPDRQDVRSRPAGGGCASLALTGYSARCAELIDGADTYAWLVERNLATGGMRASVLRQVADRRFLVVLTAVDDGPAGPARFSSVAVETSDLSGDGTPEMVFGFRNQGSGALLDLDIVDAPGRVVVHRTLEKGRAAVSTGRLDEWSAEFGAGDAACCPSRYRHGVIAHEDGAWRLVSSRREPAADVPEGEF